MQSISSDEKAGSEEKRRMMEMLQRFEDGEVGSGIPDASDDEEEDAETGMDEELAKRLEGVDLGMPYMLLCPKNRVTTLGANHSRQHRLQRTSPPAAARASNPIP